MTALHRQGLAYESLFDAVFSAHLELPRDLRGRIRRAPRTARPQLRRRLRDQLREHLAQEMRRVDCRAIERFTLSVRLARRAALPLAAARESRDRLRAYGEERVTACLEAAHARDPSFATYHRSLLHPSRPGVFAAPPPPGVPPALAR